MAKFVTRVGLFCIGCVGINLTRYYIIPRLGTCTRLAFFALVGWEMKDAIVPLAKFACDGLSGVPKAIKEMFQKSTCRTVDTSRTYSNTWTIERFTLRRMELKSATFSGRTFDERRLSWEYVLDTRNESFLTMEIRPNVFPGPYALVEVENLPQVQLAGYFGSTNVVLLRSALERNLNSNGALEMHIKVTFLDSFGYCSSRTPHPDSPQCSLAQNFADLLSSNQFTDITVKVGQRTFHAHKSVFAARSKVFAAMFRHDMQESQRNEITIPNMDPAVFEEVLRFIYTDKAEGLPRMAYELLEAAEKYDLARLKALCEIELLNGITANSAIKTLEFADLYRAEELKAQVLRFIVRNLKKIPNWEAFCNARPDLVAEVFARIE